MAKLEIDGLDDELIRRLDALARLQGMSRDAFVRETLTAAVPLSGSEEVLARLNAQADRLAASREVRAMQTEPLRTLTLDEIREGLE